MKKFVAIFFLFFFALASLQHVIILGAYLLNQDFISENFCVNKDKPEMACKGKCHMKEMMAKQESQNPNQQIELSIFTCLAIFTDLENETTYSLIEKEYATYIQIFQGNHQSSNFHPPQV